MWNIAYHGWIIYNIKLKTMKFCLMYGKNINVSYNYDTNFSHAIKKKKILPGFCIHEHWRLTGQKGKGGNNLLFNSTTSTRSLTFRHSFATLHVGWLSHTFNRTTCITRLLLDEIYHFMELPFDWLMMGCWFLIICWWFDPRFLVQQFDKGNQWSRTPSTITIGFQANRRTKCASHPNVRFSINP